MGLQTQLKVVTKSHEPPNTATKDHIQIRRLHTVSGIPSVVLGLRTNM